MATLSPRLRAVVEALPLRQGMRVLEIGGAPGAAARAVVDLIGPSGHVLIVDRSPIGIAATGNRCRDLIEAGRVSVLCASVEGFELPPGVAPFDLVFGCRVGVLDGRHPAGFPAALERLRAATVPPARLFIDTGDPLRSLRLHSE